MFLFECFLPTLGKLPKGLWSHLCTHCHPWQQPEEKNMILEDFLWLLDWPSNHLSSFGRWVIPPPLPIPLNFPKALENPGDQEGLLDKKKILLATWMVGSMMTPRPLSWERCTEGGNAISHGNMGRQERAQEKKQGSKGHLWHDIPFLFIHPELFQRPKSKKKLYN